MFRRKKSPTTLDQATDMVWPKSGWSRRVRYLMRRAARIAATPHAIALGFACGAFASFTPLIGFHFVLGMFVAWVLRASMIAAAIGTVVGNPLTFPLIWATTHKVGRWILGEPQQSAAPDLSQGLFSGGFLSASLDKIWPLIKPMIVGGLPLGLTVAIVIYFPVRGMVAAYQARRAAVREKAAEKAAARAAQMAAADGTSG